MPLVGETPRQKTLKKLSAQFPVANQQVAQGQAAARTIQMQNLAKQAPGSAGIRQAQSTAGQMAQANVQDATQAAAQNQTQQTLVGQAGLQEQGRQGRQEIAAQGNALQQSQIQKQDQLATFGAEVKQQLFDKQMQFKQDEMGRTHFNERQLADYALLKAKDADEFANYKQSAEQAYNRQQQLVEQAMKVYSTSMQQAFESKEQKLDQESKVRIENALQAAQRAAQRKANAAKNKAMAWQAVGMIGGAVAGSFAGNPAAGAAIGGGVGQMAGSTDAAQSL